MYRSLKILIAVNKNNKWDLKRQIFVCKKDLILKFYYNEEFDPGSGWTLATGLTHASRGVTEVACY